MEQVSVLETNIGSSTTGNSANTQIIFNDAGTLRGDTGLVFNKTTDALTVAGLVTAGSATITGDLTAARWFLNGGSLPGLGNGNPFAYRIGGGGLGIGAATETGTAAPIVFYCGAGGVEQYRIAPLGVFTWADGAGGTRMTLNSTGLGVGGSPNTGFLTVGSTSNVSATTSALTMLSQRATCSITSNGATDGAGTTISYSWANGGQGPLIFRNAAIANVMTLDASGNVGVGVTPSAWVSTYKALQASTYASFAGNSDDKLTAVSNNFYNDGTGKFVGNGYAASYSQYQGAHRWQTSTVSNSSGAGAGLTFTQAMTLDASGNLLVGTTSNAPAGTQSQFVNQWSGGAKWGSTFNQTVSSATSYTHIAFCTNGTVRGSIDANNATLTYGTVSDYRLKENVQPILNALTRIAALKPSTYKWKDSGTDGEGFIAHELAAVVPLAVIGQKDAVNEDGSIKAQQIDLSKVVPILVASIQELTARVQTLEAR